MYLEIITPDKHVFKGEVSTSTFPGADGTFQVLENHAPIVSPLTEGAVSYTEANGNTTKVTVSGGVVEVSGNKIIVLAESVI